MLRESASPARATQASPPHTSPPPPLRDTGRSISPRYAAELFLFEVSSQYKCVWKVKNRSSRLEHNLIDVTPDPILSRLEGLNDRMVGRVEMPGGVLVLRIVTAAYMSTRETEAQVYPGISDFQTVLTSIGARCDVLYLIKMRAALCHVLFLPYVFITTSLGTLLHDQTGIDVPTS